MERTSNTSNPLGVDSALVCQCGWDTHSPPEHMQVDPRQQPPGYPDVEFGASVTRPISASVSLSDGQNMLAKTTVRMYRQSTHTSSDRLDSRAANLYEALEASSADSAWFTR